jgi:hypothetical protein
MGETRIGRQLSDKIVACILCSIFSNNKMWAMGIGMQLPVHLVADTMCSDMSVFNQKFVTSINGRCKWLSVEQITIFSYWTVIVVSEDCTLPNLFVY